MGLLDKRNSYKPFEYQEAYEFWETHEESFWLWNEVPMEGDIKDWDSNILTPQEKSVVGSILKGFAQTECAVQNYWLRASQWFPKAELVGMCAVFAEAESRHAKAYNLVNEKLDLEEYDVFLAEPEVEQRLSNLIQITEQNPEDLAISLAVFSGFCEGVSLFGAFATLIHFKLQNKLKGTGKLMEWSLRDETIHTNAGCWLYRTLMAEYPQDINQNKVSSSVYTAAEHIVELEYNYLDYVFWAGDLPGLAKDDLKQYTKMRTNTKLQDLQLDPIFNVDEQASERISSWFSLVTNAVTQTDFFANSEANYNKRTLEITSLDEDW